MDTAVALHCWYWVVPETIHTLPTEEIFAVGGGGGENNLFLIIVNVLGHPKRGGRLLLFPPWGGGMDVFSGMTKFYI